MDCVLSLLVSWHCTIVINDNYWRLPPLLLCSLLIPLTLEMISIRLSVAIENRNTCNRGKLMRRLKAFAHLKTSQAV